MATRIGLEPTTPSVTGWCSNQLSYRAMIAQVRAASYRGNVLYYIEKSACCQAQICRKCNFLQKRAGWAVWRRQNDFKWSPRCSDHIQRKDYFKFRVWSDRVCAAIKAPVGLLSGRAVCVSRWSSRPRPSICWTQKIFPMGKNEKYRRTAVRRYFCGAAERINKKHPEVLRLRGVCLWSCYPDSNWRPHPYQGCALPTEL